MKNIKKSGLAGILLLVFFSFNTYAEQSAFTSVVAEGMAVISNNNTAMARDNAIRDAQRKAVEQAVGTIVSAETVVQNYETLSDKVYSKSQGYVQNYSVVSEMPMGNLYKVTIQANVASGSIKNDLSALGLLMSQKNMPRIMVMVAEQNIGMTYYTYWWNVAAEQADLTITENVLMQKFSENGFTVVDTSVKSKQVQISNAYKIETLNNNAIKTIGKLYDAEVVIYGKALAKLAGTVLGTSMKSSQADLSLRAVNTDNGHVIASAAKHAAAVHPSETTAGVEALKKAAEDIAESLMEQIINRWSKDVSGGTLIHLVISNINSYGNLVKFKNTITEKVRGVKAIHQRSFSAGTAALDVEYAGGSAQIMADSLAILTYDGFIVDIESLTQNSIRLKMSGN